MAQEAVDDGMDERSRGTGDRFTVGTKIRLPTAVQKGERIVKNSELRFEWNIFGRQSGHCSVSFHLAGVEYLPQASPR